MKIPKTICSYFPNQLALIPPSRPILSIDPPQAWNRATGSVVVYQVFGIGPNTQPDSNRCCETRVTWDIKMEQTKTVVHSYQSTFIVKVANVSCEPHLGQLYFGADVRRMEKHSAFHDDSVPWQSVKCHRKINAPATWSRRHQKFGFLSSILRISGSRPLSGCPHTLGTWHTNQSTTKLGPYIMNCAISDAR